MPRTDIKTMESWDIWIDGELIDSALTNIFDPKTGRPAYPATTANDVKSDLIKQGFDPKIKVTKS